MIGTHTTIVSVKNSFYDVYIGRDGFYVQHLKTCILCQRRPLNLCSIGLELIGLGNPYEIGKDGSRQSVIELYEVYARARARKDPKFRTAIKKCWGKAMGCWCDVDKGELCHGLVIKRMAEEMN